MNRLFTFCLLLVSSLPSWAAGPTLENFDQTHFRTNAPLPGIIRTRLSSSNFDTSGDTWSITNITGATGASKWFVDESSGTPGMLRPLTNLTYGFLYPSNFYNAGWFALQPKFQVLGSGTNTLDTKDSSWLLFSMTNDPTEITIQLTAGYAMGQELVLMSYTNTVFDGRFTLPADSAVSGGGLVKLNNDQDWLGENGSAIRLIWIEPDWWEQGRWFAGNTNQPGQVVINPTVDYLPYKSGAASFGDSPIYRTASGYAQVNDVNGNIFFQVKPDSSDLILFGYTNNPGSPLIQINAYTDNAFNVGQGVDLRPISGATASLTQRNSPGYMAYGYAWDSDDSVSRTFHGYMIQEAITGTEPHSFLTFRNMPLGNTYNALRLSDSQDVLAGGSSGGSHTNAARTTNYVYISSVTNVPTGVPKFASSSYAPITVDTSNNDLYFYSGGAWRVVTGGSGVSDNWVASGTTNSTLPGIGSANALIGTNGVYAGKGFYAPWWTPSIDDTFIGIHDVSLGDSDYSFLYVGNVDNGMAETNYADFTITTKTSALSPGAILNLAAVATNMASTFVVNLQPDQGVARIELFNDNTNTFAVLDNSGYTGTGTLFLSDDGTYKAAGVSDNWTAEGTTNSTLAGVALANRGVFTNGVTYSETDTAFTLSSDPARVSTTPVAVFQPVVGNSAMVVDLMPTGTPTNMLATGAAWIDIVNRDLRTVADSNNWNVARVSVALNGDVFLGATAGGTNQPGTLSVGGNEIQFARRLVGGGTGIGWVIANAGGWYFTSDVLFSADNLKLLGTTSARPLSATIGTGGILTGGGVINESHIAAQQPGFFVRVTNDVNRRIALSLDAGDQPYLAMGTGGARDIGLARQVAGVMRVTDATTGVGSLVTKRVVTAKTGAFTVSSTNTWEVFHNQGASALQINTLPAAATGLTYTFVIQDADGLEVLAVGDDTIRIAGSVTGAAGNIQATTIGNTVTLIAINATEWIALSHEGTWTVSP